MTWVKKGECDGCGYCCKAITHPIEIDFSGNDPDWLKARGIPKDGIKWLAVIDPCPQLTEENRCTIYEDRPNQCKDFPTDPSQLERIPCTYWFENVVTGEKIGGTRSPFPVDH